VSAAVEIGRRQSTATVGIADMKVSADRSDIIVTHALGSCLGIIVYDPQVRVAGMLHAMLPDSTQSPERAKENPYSFIDTGVPLLFRAAYALGAVKGRVLLTVVGGASMKTATHEGEDVFQIGRRNITALRKLLWKNGVLVHKRLVGGTTSRTLQVAVEDGSVRVTTGGVEMSLEQGSAPWP
jgi:chemotaxis protein CheD